MSRNKHAGHAAPVWASQNFLTCRATIQRLLCRTTLDKDDHVIEIGPGKGHTTGMLARLCRRVTAIEIDAKLYGGLVDQFSGIANVRLYHADFLDWKLPASGAYKVFANIPFSHTTAIVRKLTECDNPPREAWLTMEKGAAKRFTGSPRETLRSLMIKPGFEIEIVYYFLREDFHPKPGVNVVLLHLKKNRCRISSRPCGAITKGFSQALSAHIRTPCGACLRKSRLPGRSGKRIRASRRPAKSSIPSGFVFSDATGKERGVEDSPVRRKSVKRFSSRDEKYAADTVA